ncbi:spore germination protein [Paenibacillus sp. FSL R7-0340]|uniref:spore germination protein n=1 Tax=Paenibacillus sp. FSL R7-0340 TaxID=2921684 RepID=UPI000A8DECF9|nr:MULTISPECIES: spore germination protein [Paenibacillus]
MAGHDAASVELSRNVSFIEQALFYTDDLKKQAISVDGKDGMLLYIDSLVDQEMIQTHILSALYEKTDAVSHQMFTTLSSQKDTDLQNAADSLIQGYCIFMINGAEGFFYPFFRKNVCSQYGRTRKRRDYSRTAQWIH